MDPRFPETSPNNLGSWIPAMLDVGFWTGSEYWISKCRHSDFSRETFMDRRSFTGPAETKPRILNLNSVLRSLDSAVIVSAGLTKKVSEPFAWASFNVEYPSLSRVRILDKAFLCDCDS